MPPGPPPQGPPPHGPTPWQGEPGPSARPGSFPPPEPATGHGAHTPAGGASSLLGRIGAAAVALLLLVGIVVTHRLVPTEEEESGPMVTEGRVGAEVDTGGFAIRAHDLQVSRTLTEKSTFGPGDSFRTDRLWVVVDVTITGEWKASNYSDAWLERPDGTKYTLTSRISQTMQAGSGHGYDPGVPQRGLMIFEVPDATTLAETVLHVQRSGVGDTALVPEAAIDLGLDADEAKKLVERRPDRIEIAEPEYA